MKKKSIVEEPQVSHLETIVVGAGPAGLTAARNYQLRYPDSQVLVLESDNRPGGRASTGLHLLTTENLDQYPTVLSRELKGTKVRWERAWVDASEVDWSDKDWIAVIPQWSLYLRGHRSLYLGLKNPETEVAVKYQSPVSKIFFKKEEDFSVWVLETPAKIYHVKKVIWAAGYKAFQNAFGKIEAQGVLEANPKFLSEAQDYQGGIALDFDFGSTPTFEEGFDAEGIFALPVRHNGKLFLMFGALENTTVKTLTHVPAEMLSDPKEMLSFQKSLRRGLKGILTSEVNFQERWVVNNLVGGHVLGSRGLFGAPLMDSLFFVGDACLSALGRGQMDILGALDSVASLPDFNGINIEENYSAPSLGHQVAADLL